MNQMLVRHSAHGPHPSTCTLSVIVPAYNEEAVLKVFHKRLLAALAGAQVTFEVIYADDGSTDATPRILAQLRALDARVGSIRLSRNFGKEQAMSAGLKHARGAAVILIDADLQDPPELIPGMLAAWRAGADVVDMRRRSRAGESWLKRMTAHLFYRAINRLSEVPIPYDTGDFRLLSRRAVDVLNEMPERNRFMKGLFAWVGFEHASLVYDREPRAAGTTKWHYWKLWNFAIEGITGFSVAPLKVASYVGMLTALFAFAYAAYVLIKTLVSGDPVPGFPTLIVVISFLGGLQLMAIGILGEYVGRLFLETKRRPLYVVEDFHAPNLPAGARLRPGGVERAPADVALEI